MGIFPFLGIFALTSFIIAVAVILIEGGGRISLPTILLFVIVNILTSTLPLAERMSLGILSNQSYIFYDILPKLIGTVAVYSIIKFFIFLRKKSGN